MEIIGKFFGNGSDLTALQMSCRAIVTFFVAVILVRISVRRSFSMRSAFDNIIALLLGAVLSRIVYGASPFLPTVSACLVISVLHRLVALLSVTNHNLGHLFKGEKIILFQDGKVVKKNLRRSLLSEKDLMEEVRLKINRDSLDGINIIYMERNGAISVLEK